MLDRYGPVAVYVVLLALIAVAVSSGELRVALIAAGAKAILVGLEYMELRHAHRAHAAAFLGWVLVSTAGLLLAS